MKSPVETNSGVGPAKTNITQKRKREETSTKHSNDLHSINHQPKQQEKEKEQKGQDELLEVQDERISTTTTTMMTNDSTAAAVADRDNTGEESSLAASKMEVKRHSRFVELRRSLVNAEAVAAFIEENHESGLRDPKQVNSFFQAISNCPEELFSTLCEQHKRQVYIVLERMFELFSTRKVPMSPAAHEFIIRCLQNGVRKAEWAEELTANTNLNHNQENGTTTSASGPSSSSTKTTTTTTTPSLMMLLSPRELLKKIAAIDPRGRLERMVEMCTTVNDLLTCARKLHLAVTGEKTISISSSSLTSTTTTTTTTAVKHNGDIDYAMTCQLIGKLASKARRTCAAALTEESPHLNSDDTAALHGMMDAILAVTQYALATRPPAAARQPISKLLHFAKWCDSHTLLNAHHTETINALETQATRDLGAQAAQLETVLLLKALPPGDEAAAREAMDRIWQEAEGRFEPCSADVLSSIAVVAAANGISDAFRARVAERLVKTQQQQQRVQAGGVMVQLPRRALNFVNTQYSREKQESIRRMLAAQREGERDK